MSVRFYNIKAIPYLGEFNYFLSEIVLIFSSLSHAPRHSAAWHRATRGKGGCLCFILSDSDVYLVESQIGISFRFY